MKLFVVCFLGLVALSVAIPTSPPTPAPPSRGCIWIMGKCARECPEGTHSYTTGCSRLIPEATCEQPHPVAEQGIVCDYSSCHCNSPTVRDTKSNKCVQLDECPKKE